MRPSSAFIVALTIAWAMFVAAVYVPDVGRGFVKDDFGWIDAGRAALHAPADTLLAPATGFYRPVVAFTFAADYRLHDVRPRGYGFTNLALYLACVGALSVLCRALGLPPAAATLAAVLWGVNPHGINMAVVWISGRTSLCLTLFALLSAIAVVKRRYVWAALCLSAALGSKEEAILLPAILFAWHRLVVERTAEDRRRFGADWRLLLALGVPTIVYLGVRLRTAAFTPLTAPSYYRFVFAPSVVGRNLVEYADRGVTMCIIVLVLAAVIYRVRPAIADRERRLALACAAWFAGGYALTLFLPIRSSLYAVFPSVGAAIGSACLVQTLRARTDVSDWRLLQFGATLAALLLALVPTYRARNGRYVEPARLSERALQTIAPLASTAPAGAVIVLHDAADPASNFVGAFGTLASDAVRLRSGRTVSTWIDPPPADWRLAGLTPPRRDQPHVAFAVDRGRVYRVQP